MKNVYMIIAFMLLVSVLCATPATAFTGEEYIVVIDDSGDIKTYKYLNKYNPDEKYIELHSDGTKWLKSLVTFKPANIPNAPMMVVDTHKKSSVIHLSRSVDEWEINYYSSSGKKIYPCKAYLKNAGTVNLNEFYKYHNWEYLNLELSINQCISSPYTWVETFWWGEKRVHISFSPSWNIPEV